MNRIIIIGLLTFSLYQLKGQSLAIDSGIPANAILFEKLYLHIDRELYSPGERIWFKSYLVSGIDHKLIQGYKNVYVQLVSEKGKIADQKLLLSENGIARGDILLPDSLPEGDYVLRASTRYLQNFGEDSYFHRRIIVSEAKNSIELDVLAEDDREQKIDVAFLPEGGNLVMNAANHIAFKAIDQTGKGIKVSGRIVDEDDNEVVTFETSYNGMGRFVLMPQDGKNYFARIDGHPLFKYKFEPAVETGISVNYRAEGNYLVFTFTRNIKLTGEEELLLVASHKGTEIFNSPVLIDGFQQALRFYKGLFPLGISQITLYNTAGEKVAERLIFVRVAGERTVQIQLNKDEFLNREHVAVKLQSNLPENDSIVSTLSVSVVNEDYLSANGNNQSIESFLLLDSELKGTVEKPADLFVDEPDITADEKLDLIMMVNGWRSYFWNELSSYAGKKLPGWGDYGLNFDGYLTRLWNGKPVDSGKVVIGPFSGSFLFEETYTDKNGYFNFEKLYLKDSAILLINAETDKGNKRVKINIDQNLLFDSIVNVENLNIITPEIEVTLKFYREIYYRQLAIQEFEKELGTILLDDVNIGGVRMSRTDGHFRLYGEPDISFKITTDDWTFSSIAEYLETKVAGLVVDHDGIKIRASSGNPLLLVDGLEVTFDYVSHIHLGDVDRIEILKSPGLLAVYGARGGNGVISVLTKMGGGDILPEHQRRTPGRITPRFNGFYQPRKFYAPKYTAENMLDPRPDLRPTLYWNPDVEFEGNEAGFDFFTDDNVARFLIFVEGISKNGKIIYGTGSFSVSKSN